MSLYTPYYGLVTGMDCQTTTEPLDELVTAGEVLGRMDDADAEADEINLIGNQIKAVRNFLERATNMTMVESKGLTMYCETFAERTPLPFPPVISVSSVSIVSQDDGSETLLESGDYWVEGLEKKSIHMNSIYSGYGLKVVYTTGLVDTGLKALIKDALLIEVIEWYHQRSNPDETQYTLGEIALSKLRFLISV